MSNTKNTNEMEQVVDLYEDICSNMVENNVDALIEGFVQFSAPELSSVCKAMFIEKDCSQNASDFATVLKYSQEYRKASSEQGKRNVVAKGFAAALKIGSIITSVWDITAGFSSMFSIASDCQSRSI